MCFAMSNETMMDWLKTQIRVLEAWREDVATRPLIDMQLVNSLEQHYQWLTGEVSRLSAAQEDNRQIVRWHHLNR